MEKIVKNHAKNPYDIEELTKEINDIYHAKIVTNSFCRHIEKSNWLMLKPKLLIERANIH